MEDVSGVGGGKDVGWCQWEGEGEGYALVDERFCTEGALKIVMVC